MRRHIVMPVVIAAGSLLGCHNDDAAEHRAALETLDEVRSELHASAPGATNVAGLVNTLNGIRGGGKGVQAMKNRLLADAQVRLAQDAWDAAATARRQAVELAGTVASLAQAATQTGVVAQSADRDATSMGADELAQRRVDQAARRRELGNQMAASQPGLEQLKAANKADMARALALRAQASDLRSQADATTAIDGHALREKAAGLEHDAARIEATVERRMAVLDMQHEPMWQLLELGHAGLGRELDAIDAQGKAIEALADEWKAQHDSTHGRIGELDKALQESAQKLAGVIGGPLMQAWQQATSHLDKAASASQSAARNADRDGRTADTLVTVQARLAALGMSVAQAELVARCIRLLDAVAANEHLSAAAAWGDQRTVLQESLQAATDLARTTGQDAMQLADSLGAAGLDIRTSVDALLAGLPDAS